MKNTIYTKEHKDLVANLKKARVEAGMDQETVAKLLGKTQSYVSKIESGQRKIDAIQLKELAGIYKKPLSYFL